MRTLGGGRRGGSIVRYNGDEDDLRTVLLVVLRTDRVVVFWVVSSFLILEQPIAITRHCCSFLSVINEVLLWACFLLRRRKKCNQSCYYCYTVA